MGFESFNPILNLGGIFVLFLIYFGQVVIHTILYISVMGLHRHRQKQKLDAKRRKVPIPKSRKLKCVIKTIGRGYDYLNMSLYYSQLLIIFQESLFHLAAAIILYFRGDET